MLQTSFLIELSEEEEQCGFRVSEEPSGVRAVVRDLPTGLRAVKVQAPDGTTEYAICDDGLQPLYAAAKSLLDLRRRFERKPP